MTRKYLVTWTMTYDAENAMDAALQALGTLQDPENEATVFEVTNDLGITWSVDAKEERLLNSYKKE